MSTWRRLGIYQKQNNSEFITPAQRRRLNKKDRRDLYKGSRLCGHSASKCTCPF